MVRALFTFRTRGIHNAGAYCKEQRGAGAKRKRAGAKRKQVIVCLICLAAGCQQQMASQPSFRPDEPSTFFADGRAARPTPAGTVARGHLRTDHHLYTGSKLPEHLLPATLVTAGSGGGLAVTVSLAAQQLAAENSGVDTFPFPVTAEVLKHGRNRYMIYCVVCHDALGTGRGMIVERGYTPPPPYHIDRLRKAPVGHFFQVMSKGYGSMPSYGNQIPPEDRWAIAAYIRALQLSQHFPEKDLNDKMRQEWLASNRVVAGGQP